MSAYKKRAPAERYSTASKHEWRTMIHEKLCAGFALDVPNMHVAFIAGHHAPEAPMFVERGFAPDHIHAIDENAAAIAVGKVTTGINYHSYGVKLSKAAKRMLKEKTSIHLANLDFCQHVAMPLLKELRAFVRVMADRSRLAVTYSIGHESRAAQEYIAVLGGSDFEVGRRTAIMDACTREGYHASILEHGGYTNNTTPMRWVVLDLTRFGIDTVIEETIVVDEVEAPHIELPPPPEKEPPQPYAPWCDGDLTATRKQYVAVIGGEVSRRPYTRMQNARFDLLPSDEVERDRKKIARATPGMECVEEFPHGRILRVRNDGIWPRDRGDYESFHDAVVKAVTFCRDKNISTIVFEGDHRRIQNSAHFNGGARELWKEIIKIPDVRFVDELSFGRNRLELFVDWVLSDEYSHNNMHFHHVYWSRHWETKEWVSHQRLCGSGRAARWGASVDDSLTTDLDRVSCGSCLNAIERGKHLREMKVPTQREIDEAKNEKLKTKMPAELRQNRLGLPWTDSDERFLQMLKDSIPEEPTMTPLELSNWLTSKVNKDITISAAKNVLTSFGYVRTSECKPEDVSAVKAALEARFT